MIRKWSFKTWTVTISTCRGASCKRSLAKTLFPASCFVPPVSLLCGWRSLTASVVSTFFPFIQFQPVTLVSSRQTLKLLSLAALLSLSCHFRTAKKKSFISAPPTSPCQPLDSRHSLQSNPVKRLGLASLTGKRSAPALDTWFTQWLLDVIIPYVLQLHKRVLSGSRLLHSKCLTELLVYTPSWLK